MSKTKSISILLVSLVGFIDVMGIGLVYPMFASMLFQHDCLLLPDDASETTRGTCLGILLAIMPLTQFFSAPILGMLSDQKGRRKILVPALTLGVIGYLLAMVAVSYENLILLMTSRVAVGISAGTSAVVAAALADLSSPEEKAKNFGIFNMACGLGFTIGPFLGGMLSDTNFWWIDGYAVPFAFAALVSSLNLIMVFIYFEETFIAKVVGRISLTLGIQNIKKAFLIPNLRAVFFSVFLAAVGWSFYWEFTPVTWISQYGFGTATIGNFYAYGAAVYALSCGLLIRPIVSRYPNQIVLYYALIGCGLSIGMLLFHASPLWLWLYIPLQQFGIALFWPTASAVVSNSVGEDVQGETIGVLHSLDSLAFSVSPLIAGPLLGIHTSMPIVIGGSSILLAALVLGLFLKKSSATARFSV